MLETNGKLNSLNNELKIILDKYSKMYYEKQEESICFENLDEICKYIGIIDINHGMKYIFEYSNNKEYINKGSYKILEYLNKILINKINEFESGAFENELEITEKGVENILNDK